MTTMPYFSVIINTHNNENTITKTLMSVVNQTFNDFEIIVVDDASSDSTVSIARKILNNYHGRNNIIELKKNKGISSARNVGISNSIGEYVAFLDGDDLWAEDKLTIQYDFLSRNFIDWIFGNYSVVDDNYKILGGRYRKEGVYDYNSIINNGNPIGMLTVVVKRNLLNETPFRNIRHEDYDLWIRLAKKGIIGYLQPNILGKYMKHSNSVSSNKFYSMLWTYKVFRNNSITVCKAIWLMFKYINNYFFRQKKCRK